MWIEDVRLLPNQDHHLQWVFKMIQWHFVNHHSTVHYNSCNSHYREEQYAQGLPPQSLSKTSSKFLSYHFHAVIWEALRSLPSDRHGSHTSHSCEASMCRGVACSLRKKCAKADKPFYALILPFELKILTGFSPAYWNKYMYNNGCAHNYFFFQIVRQVWIKKFESLVFFCSNVRVHEDQFLF